MSDTIVENDKQLDLATQALATIDKTENKENESPIGMVEKTVADFLNKAIEATLSSNRLATALEDSLINDLPEMKPNEKIALINIERSSMNDRIFKLLSPSFGLLTAKQQAEIQAKAKQESQNAAVQVNIGQGNTQDSIVASKTPAEVETGLYTLFQLIASKASQYQNSNNTSEKLDK